MYPELASPKEAMRRSERPLLEKVRALIEVDDDDGEAIRWKRTTAEVASLQKRDTPIAQVFYWAKISENGGYDVIGNEYHPKRAGYTVRIWDTGLLVAMERDEYRRGNPLHKMVSEGRLSTQPSSLVLNQLLLLEARGGQHVAE